MLSIPFKQENIDRQYIIYGKCLIDSGTLGSKSKTCYNYSQEPSEEGVPMLWIISLLWLNIAYNGVEMFLMIFYWMLLMKQRNFLMTKINIILI